MEFHFERTVVKSGTHTHQSERENPLFVIQLVYLEKMFRIFAVNGMIMWIETQTVDERKSKAAKRSSNRIFSAGGTSDAHGSSSPGPRDVGSRAVLGVDV